MKLSIVILAAGKGTRMKSNLPKVCHKVGSQTMIEHVLNTSKSILTNTEHKKEHIIVVVVSKDNIETIRKILNNNLDQNNIRFKIQQEQLGTAHAVISGLDCCDPSNDLLVLLGDVPLIKAKTLLKVTKTECDAVIIGFRNTDITNKFGRILVKNNRVNKIVEYNDATEEERKIQLCNSGMLWIKSSHIPLLHRIGNQNSKSEYYLTDIIGIMVNEGLEIGFLEIPYDECIGVNTPEELEKVNKIYNNNNKEQ